MLERWRTLWAVQSPSYLISNTAVEMRGLDMRALPENRNFTTSLWDHFGRYPLDELRHLPRHQRALATRLFLLLRYFFPKALLHETWLLENQPIATPLWNRASDDLIPPPGCARRGMCSPPPKGTLGLPSRVVWLRPVDQADTRDNHRDARLENKGPGHWHRLQPSDFPAAAELYTRLYREKYSPLNPAFTPLFLQLAAEHGILELEGLSMGGHLQAVNGTYQVGTWLTTPVIGYDLDRPASAGLYRRATHHSLQKAQQRGINLHRSAGVGQFKRNRGARPQMEWIWLNPSRPDRRLQALSLLARAILNVAQTKAL